MTLPMHVIFSRLNRLTLAGQAEMLKTVIAVEKPYSIRRKELERMHVDVRRRQIALEIRRERKRT